MNTENCEMKDVNLTNEKNNIIQHDDNSYDLKLYPHQRKKFSLKRYCLDHKLLFLFFVAIVTLPVLIIISIGIIICSINGGNTNNVEIINFEIINDGIILNHGSYNISWDNEHCVPNFVIYNIPNVNAAGPFDTEWEEDEQLDSDCYNILMDYKSDNLEVTQLVENEEYGNSTHYITNSVLLYSNFVTKVWLGAEVSLRFWNQGKLIIKGLNYGSYNNTEILFSNKQNYTIYIPDGIFYAVFDSTLINYGYFPNDKKSQCYPIKPNFLNSVGNVVGCKDFII